MRAAEVHGLPLPDMPHAMWVRDELADYLRLPDDGTRVEIVGGEIVVSPGPVFNHNVIVSAVSDAITLARAGNEQYPWRAFQTTDLNLSAVGDGYIPDLIVLHDETVERCQAMGMRHPRPEDVELAVEVTSPSTALFDREPTDFHRKGTKWTGYARSRIPYYLLVDAAPTIRRATLFSDPDPDFACYHSKVSWSFDKPIDLPAPFSVTVDTSRWQPWDA
jgi:Uma2 family endonuclease